MSSYGCHNKFLEIWLTKHNRNVSSQFQGRVTQNQIDRPIFPSRGFRKEETFLPSSNFRCSRYFLGLCNSSLPLSLSCFLCLYMYHQIKALSYTQDDPIWIYIFPYNKFTFIYFQQSVFEGKESIYFILLNPEYLQLQSCFQSSQK